MPSRRRRRPRVRWRAASRCRARGAGRRLLAAGVAAVATLATALTRPPAAGAVDAGPAGAAGPVAEGDGGALALWIVAEVVVLVVGVVALRVWTDHRPRRRGRS
jgi:hypothetical protein